MKTNIFHLTILLFFLTFTNIVFAEQSEVYIIQVADAISPGTADFIKSGIKTAEENEAVCVIIELDTPGGLAESMRLIVQTILASKVPVVVFVYPGIGQLLVDSVTKRDFPVVQACCLIFAATFILLNLAADVGAILTNPRLRHPK